MEGNEMKEFDCVEVVVEKEMYAKEGVHKGMQGWICHPDVRNGCRLVNFPQMGEREDIATLPIKEEDLKQIDALHAEMNQQIKAQY